MLSLRLFYLACCSFYVLLLGSIEPADGRERLPQSMPQEDIVARCGQVPKRACLIDAAVAAVKDSDPANLAWFAAHLAELGELEEAALIFGKASRAQDSNVRNTGAAYRYLLAMARQGQADEVYAIRPSRLMSSAHRVEVLIELEVATGEVRHLEAAINEMQSSDDEAIWLTSITLLATAHGRRGDEGALLALVDTASKRGAIRGSRTDPRLEVAAAGIHGALEASGPDRALVLVARMPSDLQPELRAPIISAMIELGRVEEAERLLGSLSQQGRLWSYAEITAIGKLAAARGDEAMVRDAMDLELRFVPLTQERLSHLLLLARTSSSVMPLGAIRAALPTVKRTDRLPIQLSEAQERDLWIDAWSCVTASASGQPEWIEDCVNRIERFLTEQAKDAPTREDAVAVLRAWVGSAVSPSAANHLLRLLDQRGIDLGPATNVCTWLANAGETDAAWEVLRTKVPPNDDHCAQWLLFREVRDGRMEKALELLPRIANASPWARAVLEIAKIAPN